MQEIKTVSIIGVGLIGGSLGMALKKSGQVGKVIGIGRHLTKLKLAKKLGAVDSITTNLAAGVREADLVVICYPVGLIAGVVKGILPALKDGCIVTDVGSVKAPIIKEVNKIIGRRKVFFVGGHPLAGSEQAGITHARSDLFEKATWVLTPTNSVPKNIILTLQKMASKTGAKVLLLDAQIHDQIVSVTSHLPHLLAGSLVSLVGKRDKKGKKVGLLTAGSFRDMTRIASSNPIIWTDIFLMNKTEIIKATQEFIIVLQNILKILQAGNAKKIMNNLIESKFTREQYIKSNAENYCPKN